MPEWIKEIAPFIAILSIIVNIVLFIAKRKIEIKDKESNITYIAQVDRKKISIDIAEKLAPIFNAYTVETTNTVDKITELRMMWGNEGILVDLVHDEATGKKLTSLVSSYLDAMTGFIQGNILAADLHTRRSAAWQEVRKVLDSYVQKGSNY